ncbi:HlyC/CorC family transporter [bacterium]|nr:HlyC/CorC family transporter [bacterium]
MDTDVPIRLALLQVSSADLPPFSVVLLVLGAIVCLLSGFTAHSAVAARVGLVGRRTLARRAAAATVILLVIGAALIYLGLRVTDAGVWEGLATAVSPSLLCILVGFISGVTAAGRPETPGLVVRTGNLLADALGCWLPADSPTNGNGHSDEPEFEITMASGEEVEAEEREYIENILEFGETTAHEVMTPRTDVVALDISWEPERIIQAVAEARFSRFPVYANSIDEIVGIVHLRHLLEFLAKGEGIESLKLRALMMEPLFVPESKKVDDVLRELQRRKSHMAIVLDEYGGTEGILTIEDLLEEIVGEIQDEYDDESLPVHRRDDGSLVVDGQLPLVELNEELATALCVEDVDTLGGYVTHMLGHIPERRETLIEDDLQFTVLSVDKNRVRRVLVERIITPRTD